MTDAADGGALERRVLPLLAELSQQLAGSLDLQRTLTEAVNRIAQAMQAEAASVFLLDGDRLVCRACAGPVDLTGFSLGRGEGIVGRAVQTGTCEIVRDVHADPDFTGRADRSTGFVTRSVVCAPLVTANGPIGALQVVNKRDGGLFDAADRDVLRLLAAPTALAVNGARMAEALVEQTRIKRELGMARRLQRALLPRRRRGAYPVRGLNLPAREISGDFYDFFELPDGRIGFACGDVSGKGLDASFLMVRCASLLRWVGQAGHPPAVWLQTVNDELVTAIAGGMFVCAVAGYFDPRGNSVVWANAGFPPVVRVGEDGRVQTFPAEGPPLGILPGMAYTEQRCQLAHAALYCFSDGATDVRDAAGRTLDVEGFVRLLVEHAGLPPESRLRRIVRHLRRFAVTDDTTLLLVQPLDGRLLRWAFEARPAELREMRRRLGAALGLAGIGRDERQLLVLAVDEACANIIRHAYGGACSGRITLEVSRIGGTLRFELRDDAPCVDPAQVRPQTLGECRSGGLGVAIFDQLMDHWTLQPDPSGSGNLLVMDKQIADWEGEP